MKSIHRRYFGPEEGRIQIRYHNGTSVVDGFILKQIGTRRFVVTSDGETTTTVTLATNTDDATNLTAGLGTIIVTLPDASTVYAKTIYSKILTTTEGVKLSWSDTDEEKALLATNDMDVLPPEGFLYVVDNDGAYIVDEEGAFLVVVA